MRLRPALALLALLALVADASRGQTAPPARPVRAPLETAPVRRLGAADYVGANDLARLLEATKYWRADVRKLVLRAGPHRITLTVDVPFAVVDDRTLWLRAPAVSLRGELQAPVALLEVLPADGALPRLVHEPRLGAVVRVPRGGLVGSPVVTAVPGGTRVVFPVEPAGDVAVTGRSRSHFRLRLAGTFAGALPDSLPRGGRRCGAAHPLVRGTIRLRGNAAGVDRRAEEARGGSLENPG